MLASAGRPARRLEDVPDTAANALTTTASEALLERARAVIPGGVNSPVRAFRAVGGAPRFIRSAQGPWLFDADGNRYVDLLCSWGPMILGHARADVLEAVEKAAAQGFSFGTPSENEVLLAEEIVARVEPVEQVRLVSSGTEATMSAIRLARAGDDVRDVVVGQVRGGEERHLPAEGREVVVREPAVEDPVGVVDLAVAQQVHDRARGVGVTHARHCRKGVWVRGPGLPGGVRQRRRRPWRRRGGRRR